MRRRFLVAAFGLTLGCAPRSAATVQPLAVQVTLADQAWNTRATVGLERSARLLRDAHRVAPDDVEVNWRLVRLLLAEGLASDDPRARLGAYGAARLVALECLDTTTPFHARLSRFGWHDALDTVLPDRGACVAWGALAWARWMVEMGGDASAIDAPAVRLMVVRGRELGADPAVLAWADALRASGGPPAQQDLALAAESFDVVARAMPGAAQPRIDLALLVAVTSGDEAKLGQVRESLALTPDPTPEGVRATARFLAETAR